MLGNFMLAKVRHQLCLRRAGAPKTVKRVLAILARLQVSLLILARLDASPGHTHVITPKVTI